MNNAHNLLEKNNADGRDAEKEVNMQMRQGALSRLTLIGAKAPAVGRQLVAWAGMGHTTIA